MPYYYINDRKKVRLKRFINFWSELYIDPKRDHYKKNIVLPLTAESLKVLFRWKFRTRYYNQNSVKIFMRSLDKLRKLPPQTPAEDFLNLFGQGGAIYRIFLLHCWNPKKYPIFDQHAYRAMKFIQNGNIDEIPQNQAKKIEKYLNEYIPFIGTIRQQNPALSLKTIDEALFVFGQFLKAHPSVFL